MNKVLLRGNLGKNPELRYTGEGTAVCNFTVATNERYTDKQGVKQELTEWHRIVVWGKNAENCVKFLSAGRSVLIEGKLKTRKWTDREGQDRYTTEINARDVEFLAGGRKDETEQSVSTNEVPTAAVDPVATEESQRNFVSQEDVPF